MARRKPAPVEFSRFGAFTLLGEKSTSDVKALMDELVAKDAASLSPDEARLVAVHNAFLDTDAIDAAGLAPAQGYINAMAGAASMEELAMLWATPGYPSPLGGFVNVDAKQPDRYVSYLSFGGLGLPDRDYYLDDSEKGQTIQAAYRDYLTFLFGEAVTQTRRAPPPPFTLWKSGSRAMSAGRAACARKPRPYL